MIVAYTVVLSVGLSDVGKKQLGDIDKQLMKAIDYRFGKQLGLSYGVLTMQERHLGIPEGATHYTSNILEDHGVNINKFTRQAIAEKIKKDWKEIKAEKTTFHCPF